LKAYSCGNEENSAGCNRSISQCLWLAGVVIVLALALPLAPAFAQSQRAAGFAGAVARPALSGWAVYHAGVSQAAPYGGAQLSQSYHPNAYQAAQYVQPRSGFANPSSPESQALMHHPHQYPYYNSYVYPYYRSYLYPYDYLDATTLPGMDMGSGGGGLAPEEPSPGAESAQAATRVPSARAASVKVLVPDREAQVTFQGQRTATKGIERTYKTPPLAPGAQYYYDVSATWKEKGKEITRTRTIRVSPGGSVVLDFNKPAADVPPETR